ncbi:MAG: alcohol dehydrogenase catalytic domain-containing protein [Gammaproteobacteria bacterium]
MPIDIRAAVLHAPHTPLRIETLRLDDPKQGEVLIRLAACGICHSDQGFIDGHVRTPGLLPIVLGHEGAGVVVACGPGVESLAVGDHVLPMAMSECRRCPACLSRRSNLCEAAQASMAGAVAYDGTNRMSLDGRRVYQMAGVGMFATHTIAHEWNVAKIDPDVPLDVACLVSCAIGTGVGAAVAAARVNPGSSVAVFGLGGIGLNVVQGARLAGAAVIIGVDPNPGRESIGRRLGLTHFLDPRAQDPVAAIRALVAGGVDFAFEAVGRLEIVRQALACTHSGWGLATMLGVPTGPDVAVTPYDLLWGRRLQGCSYGGLYPRSDAPRLVDWYRRGMIDIDSLITHRIGLDDINQGFDLLRTGEAVRTVVTMG